MGDKRMDKDWKFRGNSQESGAAFLRTFFFIHVRRSRDSPKGIFSTMLSRGCWRWAVLYSCTPFHTALLFCFGFELFLATAEVYPVRLSQALVPPPALLAWAEVSCLRIR